MFLDDEYEQKKYAKENRRYREYGQEKFEFLSD